MGKITHNFRMVIKRFWWKILSRIVSDEYIENCAYEIGMDFKNE